MTQNEAFPAFRAEVARLCREAKDSIASGKLIVDRPNRSGWTLRASDFADPTVESKAGELEEPGDRIARIDASAVRVADHLTLFAWRNIHFVVTKRPAVVVGAVYPLEQFDEIVARYRRDLLLLQGVKDPMSLDGRGVSFLPGEKRVLVLAFLLWTLPCLCVSPLFARPWLPRVASLLPLVLLVGLALFLRARASGPRIRVDEGIAERSSRFIVIRGASGEHLVPEPLEKRIIVGLPYRAIIARLPIFAGGRVVFDLGREAETPEGRYR